MSDERRHNREWDDDRPLAELISAYLDDRDNLSRDDLDRMKLLLDEDPAAQQVHAEIEVIRQELRSLDPIQAPRSYYLDAEMIGRPKPVVLQETSAWYVRQASTVRWATAAAAVLFVFILGADLVLNSVLSDPADSTDTSQMDQSAIMSRQGDEESGTGAANAEAIEDESGDDAGGGAEAPAIETPEVAGDAADGGIDSAALVPAQDDEPEDAADGAAEPTTVAEATDAGSDDSATNESALAFDADDASGESDAADRRFWRIAEFGLVVIIGLLITAMVVLSRIDRTTTRSAND